MGHKIPTNIDDEIEEGEEDEQEVVIDIHVEVPGVDIYPTPLLTSRAFSVMKDDIAKYGATDTCR